MKKANIFLAFLFVTLVSLGLAPVSIGDEGHEATAECDTPTEFIEIIADPDSEGVLAYDKTQLNVDKGG